jgi:hypothetical protein
VKNGLTDFAKKQGKLIYEKVQTVTPKRKIHYVSLQRGRIQSKIYWNGCLTRDGNCIYWLNGRTSYEVFFVKLLNGLMTLKTTI